MRAKYMLYLCPNHITSPRRVPGLDHHSKKRKRTQNPDLDYSDDDAVTEILLQRRARQQQEEEEEEELEQHRAHKQQEEEEEDELEERAPCIATLTGVRIICFDTQSTGLITTLRTLWLIHVGVSFLI